MTPNRDLLIYLVHAGFWGSFGLTRAVTRGRSQPDAAPAPQAAAGATAPFSRTLVALHSVAFGVMYFALGNTVIPGRVPERFPGQRLVGTLVIASGAAMMSWALQYFQSWRFRAQVDAGHQLATGGPFRFVRHPIYLGLGLLAIGSAIWVPTPLMGASALLMAVGSDLRGRAEEALLLQAFGPEYARYSGRTRRFLPGIY